MEKNKTILLVEDDVELAGMTQQFLSSEGFHVHWVDNGLTALQAVTDIKPDLVLLDVMLPGLNGIDVCRKIRPEFNGPVLMLTAKDDDMVEVTSLNTGANGYLTKPVRPHVLLAHIQAQLRSGSPQQHATRTQGVHIKPSSRTAQIDGRELLLSSAEFDLLNFLVKRAGQIVTRDDLYQALRGIPFDGLDRAIDMQISVLRRKMGDENPPYKYIKTVRAKGYMLVAR